MSSVNEGDNPYAMKPSLEEPPILESVVHFPLQALVGSLLVMLPWPLLAISACSGLSLFEQPNEAAFMFGSVTMIFLLPLALVVTSEWIYGVLIGVVWLSALLLPLCSRTRSLHPRYHVQLVLVGQAIFSAAQAAFGFLVVLGKHC